MRQKSVPPVPKNQNGLRVRRFTDEEVWEIRKRFMAGETKTSMAREFGVSIPTVSSAVHGTGTYKNT